jgi:hypothetical protein
MLNNAIKQANQEGRSDVEALARKALEALGPSDG